jgi:hypothetical protein
LESGTPGDECLNQGAVGRRDGVSSRAGPEAAEPVIAVCNSSMKGDVAGESFEHQRRRGAEDGIDTSVFRDGLVRAEVAGRRSARPRRASAHLSRPPRGGRAGRAPALSGTTRRGGCARATLAGAARGRVGSPSWHVPRSCTRSSARPRRPQPLPGASCSAVPRPPARRRRWDQWAAGFRRPTRPRRRESSSSGPAWRG